MENNKVYLPHINTKLWTVTQPKPEVEEFIYTQGDQKVIATPEDHIVAYPANQNERFFLEEHYHNNFERNLLPDGKEVGQE